MAQPAPGALDGVRVLDFTQLVQGPMATQVLGDLGAEVYKVEKVDGEWMRGWGIFASRTHGEYDSFLAFNRNKKSVCADLKSLSVVEHLLALAPEFDVVVENFRPGVMERLGLGYEAFAEANPAIVYASANGFGDSGPYSQRPGQDLLVQAMSGLTYLSGAADGPPVPCGIGVSDEFGALYLVIGILAALLHRKASGQGQRVGVNLFASTLAAQQQELTVHLNSRLPMRRPVANIGHVGATAPFGIYQTTDGYMALAMMPCPRLGAILGVGWLDDLDTNEKMFAQRDRAHEMLAGHFAARPTSEWLALLEAHDVWCAEVKNYDAVEEDPQVQHLGLLWDVPIGDGEGLCFRTVGSPITFSRTPAAVCRGVPRSGEHTSELLPPLPGARSGPASSSGAELD